MSDTNKTAHTPGPWEYRINGAFVHIHRAGDPFAPIAHMNYTVGEELSLERARLIAAAPEMLDALTKMVERITYYAELKEGEIPNIEDWAYTYSSGDMKAARAAIAKATGAAA